MSLEVKCVNLDLLRAEQETRGSISIDPKTSRAKLFIASKIGTVEIRYDEEVGRKIEIPITEDPLHQRFMREALNTQDQSPCWYTKSGCVAVRNEEIIARGFSHPVLKGQFCQDLAIQPKEVLDLLDKESGERLDFCQTIHDVEGVVAEAARDGRKISGLDWYLSFEPCDHCANALVKVEASQVYFTRHSLRGRYYSTTGTERVIDAGIPLYFVKMPQDAK